MIFSILLSITLATRHQIRESAWFVQNDWRHAERSESVRTPKYSCAVLALLLSFTTIHLIYLSKLPIPMFRANYCISTWGARVRNSASRIAHGGRRCKSEAAKRSQKPNLNSNFRSHEKPYV